MLVNSVEKKRMRWIALVMVGILLGTVSPAQAAEQDPCPTWPTPEGVEYVKERSYEKTFDHGNQVTITVFICMTAQTDREGYYYIFYNIFNRQNAGNENYLAAGNLLDSNRFAHASRQSHDITVKSLSGKFPQSSPQRSCIPEGQTSTTLSLSYGGVGISWTWGGVEESCLIRELDSPLVVKWKAELPERARVKSWSPGYGVVQKVHKSKGFAQIEIISCNHYFHDAWNDHGHSECLEASPRVSWPIPTPPPPSDPGCLDCWRRILI